MTGLDDLIGDLNEQLDAEREAAFRLRLRERLLRQPKEWLVDQLLTRVGDESAPRVDESRHDEAERAARAERIKAMCVDEACLNAFLDRCRDLTRERLEAEGYLFNPPVQGGASIEPACRTPRGEALLREAKDLLEALLFGDAQSGVPLARVQRELLTITVARAKAGALASVLSAATEIDVAGTWRDPERVSDDERAANTQFEVEYGEAASERIGRGIALALRLINDLEINEQVLYARMENVEESSIESA